MRVPGTRRALIVTYSCACAVSCCLYSRPKCFLWTGRRDDSRERAGQVRSATILLAWPCSLRRVPLSPPPPSTRTTPSTMSVSTSLWRSSWTRPRPVRPPSAVDLSALPFPGTRIAHSTRRHASPAARGGQYGAGLTDEEWEGCGVEEGAPVAGPWHEVAL